VGNTSVNGSPNKKTEYDALMRNLFKLLTCTLFVILSFGCDDSSDDTGTNSQGDPASTVTGTAELGGFYSVRQPNTNKIRTWEVAGTAHADAFILNLNSQSAAIEAVGVDIMSLLPCGEANDGPQRHVIKAAMRALTLWIID